MQPNKQLQHKMDDYITNIEEEEELHDAFIDGTAPEISVDNFGYDVSTETDVSWSVQDDIDMSSWEAQDQHSEEDVDHDFEESFGPVWQPADDVYSFGTQQRIIGYMQPRDVDMDQREFYLRKANEVIHQIVNGAMLSQMIIAEDIAGLKRALDTITTYIVNYTNLGEAMYTEYQELSTWIWQQIHAITRNQRMQQLQAAQLPLQDHDLIPGFEMHCPIM